MICFYALASVGLGCGARKTDWKTLATDEGAGMNTIALSPDGMKGVRTVQ
jgi:hypothetical protein